jgi:signal transduction histidine kinase
MRVRDVLLRHRDVVLAAVLAVGYVAEVVRWDDSDHAIAVPLALAAGIALSTRRRLPFATFLVVTVLDIAVVHYSPGLDESSIFFVAIFLLNLWSLGRYARGVEAWLGALGMLATVVGFVVGDGAHDPSDVFFAMAFCGTPWAAGVAVRLRREREHELAASNAELEEQARVAVAAERSRIARELHDVVSHAIAVTVLQARGGRKLVGRDDDAVRSALDAIEQTNTSALSDMRRLLSLLRDTEDGIARDEPQPSMERLDELVEQVRRSGLDVEMHVSGEPHTVPPGVDLSAYRIVQEALTNVLKHGGPGARATVEVRYGSDDLDVTVRNTGRAPEHPRSNGGHGLIGIRERAAVTGGQVEAGPESGGYAVRARLPYAVDA